MPTTSENNKRIAKNMVMLYIRMFFLMLIGLFTSRVVLRTLGVTDFGIYNVVGGVVAMMGLLNGAMSVATTRYLTFELGKNDMVRLKQVFSMCLTIYLMLSGIFLIAAETIGLWFMNTQLIIPPERMMAANWVYQFSIISVINSLLMNPYNAVLIAHEKMNIYAYISILEAVLKLAIVYVLIIIPFDRLIVYGFLFMMMSIITTMIYRVYCIRHYIESRYKFFWDKPLFRELTTYSGWNLFGSASALVKGQGLNILLNMFFNPAVNASRGIAYQINTQITNFFTNFYTAVRPQITKYYAQNDLEDMFKLVLRSSKFSFFLILFISLPVIVEAPFIIQLWLGQLPEYVIEFTRLVIIISAVDAMASPTMTAAHATGHIKLYQSVVGTIIMMNIPISYINLKYFHTGPVSVFIVSLLLSVIALFVRLWIVKRLIPTFPVMKYIKEIFIKCMVLSFVAALFPVMVHCLTKTSPIMSCVNILIAFVTSGISIYCLGLTVYERSVLVKTVRKKLHL